MDLVAYIPQFYASTPSEFGVQAKNVNCELDLVHDALARTVATGKKLKVFNRIMLTIAVNVVNGFFGKKLSTDVLFHDVAMFKHVASSGFWPNVSRKMNPNVAVSFYVFPVFAIVELLFSASAVILAFAFSITELLFVIQRTAWSAAERIHFIALLACEKISFGSIFASPFRRAWYGAVKRIFSELISISIQVSRLVRKWISTFSAVKRDAFRQSSRATVNCFMRSMAYWAAKFLSCLSCVSCGEFLSALQTVACEIGSFGGLSAAISAAISLVRSVLRNCEIYPAGFAVFGGTHQKLSSVFNSAILYNCSAMSIEGTT
jgi:hypothetical protein